MTASQQSSEAKGTADEEEDLPLTAEEDVVISLLLALWEDED